MVPAPVKVPAWISSIVSPSLVDKFHEVSSGYESVKIDI